MNIAKLAATAATSAALAIAPIVTAALAASPAATASAATGMDKAVTAGYLTRYVPACKAGTTDPCRTVKDGRVALRTRDAFGTLRYFRAGVTTKPALAKYRACKEADGGAMPACTWNAAKRGGKASYLALCGRGFQLYVFADGSVDMI